MSHWFSVISFPSGLSPRIEVRLSRSVRAAVGAPDVPHLKAMPCEVHRVRLQESPLLERGEVAEHPPDAVRRRVRAPIGLSLGNSSEIALQQGPHLLAHFVDEPNGGEHEVSQVDVVILNAIDPTDRPVPDGFRALILSLLNGLGKPMRPEVVILESRLVANGDLTAEERSGASE